MPTFITSFTRSTKISLISCFTLFVVSCSHSKLDTHLNGVTAVTDYRELPSKDLNTRPVVSGLDAPWGFTWLPNGDMLITEKFGQLRMAERDSEGKYSLVSTPITGIPNVFSDGHGGLLDITLHPDFEDNRLLYFSFSEGDESANRLKVNRAELNEYRLENMQTIFEVSHDKPDSQHYGSRFQWLQDKTLLVSIGDGGNPPVQFNEALIRDQAQNLGTHFGSIIRINDDGTVPDDNPFVENNDAQSEIWSYGHRNVQGIALDKERQQIFVSEHGSRGGDEINQVQSGYNYGWPITTYSVEYDFSGTPISENQSLAGMQEPLAVWTPSIAPSDIVYYSNKQYEDWQGDLFLAAMLLRSRDSLLAYPFSPAGAIIRVDLDNNNNLIGQELYRIGDVRVRGLELGPDGYLYALTNPTSVASEPGNTSSQIVRVEFP